MAFVELPLPFFDGTRPVEPPPINQAAGTTFFVPTAECAARYGKDSAKLSLADQWFYWDLHIPLYEFLASGGEIRRVRAQGGKTARQAINPVPAYCQESGTIWHQMIPWWHLLTSERGEKPKGKRG